MVSDNFSFDFYKMKDRRRENCKNCISEKSDKLETSENLNPRG